MKQSTYCSTVANEDGLAAPLCNNARTLRDLAQLNFDRGQRQHVRRRVHGLNKIDNSAANRCCIDGCRCTHDKICESALCGISTNVSARNLLLLTLVTRLGRTSYCRICTAESSADRHGGHSTSRNQTKETSSAASRYSYDSATATVTMAAAARFATASVRVTAAANIRHE